MKESVPIVRPAALKRTAAVVLSALLLVFVLAAPGFAAVRVQLNGQQVSFDVPPRIEEGRTLVPLRAIFEALGAEVHWDAETRTVVATRGGTTVTLPVGSPSAKVNGLSVALDVPAKIVDGRTLVPLRFVSEALGADVGWDGTSQTVSITLAAVPAPVLTPEQIADRALPATVFIKTDRGFGSGFFIDGNGTVVTNYHVIDGAGSAAIVTNDQKEHPVVGIMGHNKALDVAILKTGASGYPVLKLAKTTVPRAGQSVVAIGSPFGLDATVSDGIISNPARLLEGNLYIQHTAPISPGSSGGPLLLSTGEVVGMNTATIPGGGIAQNINLAVPVITIDAVAATRGATPQPLDILTSGSASMSLTEYRAWLDGTYWPKLRTCLDQSDDASDLADQGKLTAAKESSLNAAQCFQTLAYEIFVTTPPGEAAETHFGLMMQVELDFAAQVIETYVIDTFLSGDYSAGAGMRQAESFLWDGAAKYQKEALSRLP